MTFNKLRQEFMTMAPSQELDHAVFAKVYPLLEKQEKRLYQNRISTWFALSAVAASFVFVFWGFVPQQNAFDEIPARLASVNHIEDLEYFDQHSVDFSALAEMEIPLDQHEIWQDLDVINSWSPDEETPSSLLWESPNGEQS
jgi:hypothetical protein